MQVSIDFDSSHLFFPRIIIISLLFVGVIILIQRREDIWCRLRSFSLHQIINKGNVKAYIFVGLIGAYILGMESLGELFPNTGYAFLILTIPLMFLIPFLVEDTLTKKQVVFIAINAVVSPITAWLVLGQLFNITLP
ncbi:tripartite tricarboxylate transporter TctB family protein [Vibrio mediterranei]|uniref:tripartite tricarboxylate transporter TctB family protein n=1 Tax=Vibrio mediterranei TaxID=689 RepID=UPI001EFE73C7|nr:tripartite tricarboxylate transporter TctB family protein [Vibrio mediterranei]MCG9625215.1 tripartite tricarboxylate transporter TctB family protein [Vibrio mediterranei]